MPTTIRKISAGLVSFLGGTLLALAAAESGAAWYTRVWQTDDGLPAASVTGIAQTRDGCLWLATQAGLARFDGAQFVEVPVPLGRAHPIIRAMLCDRAENFWLAEDGGLVVRFGPAGARLFTPIDGLPDALPLQMIESPDGSVWISYDDRAVIRIFPDGRVIRVRFAEGLTDDGTCSLTVDAQGVLWFDKAVQYGLLRNNHFHKTCSLEERNAQILAVPGGVMWFCTATHLLRSVSNTPPVAVADWADGAGRFKPTVLFQDSAGLLWIGTAADGLYQVDGTNVFKVETSQNNIRAIMQDAEGSIWVGTDGGGLDRLRTRTVELHGRDEGLPFETVRSLCEDRQGNLWVVTQDGALTRLPAGNWNSVQKIDDWPGYQAHCVVADHDGSIWIGTYQHGLYCWRNGSFIHYGTQNGLAGGTIRSLLVDTQNDLWIGLEGEHLVQRLHLGSFQTYVQPPGSRAVRAMAQDTAGRIWLGTLDGTLLLVTGDGLADVSPPPGSVHPIRCLSATPDGSLWIGYSANGICRLKAGRFSHIGRASGLFDGNICALMPDDAGRMWFASDRGIFYASLAQLNDFADTGKPPVQSIFYGRDSGLPSLQAYYGYWPGALKDRAGEILFPTHSGIAIAHPDRVQANLMPPNVLIQTVVVDGRPVSMKKSRDVPQLPPNHRRIEVSFTAPSFIAPEQVRFRYRLEGWSDVWSDISPERAAVFLSLPAGDYTFHVIACNNFGVWNNIGASFHFTVAPYFWQTWWFRLAALLAFSAVIVAIVRFVSYRRIREMLKKVEQEAALQKERTRIAQDMHDELGARFTQISLLGELTRNSMAEPGKAADFMGQISRVAQVGVKSLDEIVWAVNPRNDTLSDLLDYTGQYAIDFLAAAGLPCRLDFADTPSARPISGNIRHGVFLIVKETLNNVVKHARASRVKIIFDLNGDEMYWRLEDDGRGFAVAPDNALADGLRNIRQRAAALGGTAEIKSRPGAGTWVIVKIPLPKM